VALTLSQVCLTDRISRNSSFKLFRSIAKRSARYINSHKSFKPEDYVGSESDSELDLDADFIMRRHITRR
jgi:hypothetical protein